MLPIASTVVYAERLPVRTYTTADGLPHDRLGRIRRDSHGFLWFCAAAGGLSRFDGTTFVTYPSDFLQHTINDIFEDQDGSYWVATNGAGVYRLDPRPRQSADDRSPRFTAIAVGNEPATNRVNTLFRDRRGQLWAGTDAGLFVLEPRSTGGSARHVPLEPSSDRERTLQIWSFAEDRAGLLWVGTSDGLRLRSEDGRVARVSIHPDHGVDHVWSLLADPSDRIWIGSQVGLTVIRRANGIASLGGPSPSAAKAAADEYQPIGRLGDVHSYTQADGLSGNAARALLWTADGHLWIGTSAGVTEFDGVRFRAYSRDERLSKGIHSLAQDTDGNVWVATDRGAIRIALQGLTTYTEADGLADRTIRTIFESQSGELCALSQGQYVNVFDGRRFRAIRPKVPEAIGSDYALGLQDRFGEWWMPVADRLFRFARVGRLDQLADATPTAIYSSRDGMPEGECWKIFEDSRGDVWTATRARTRDMIARWDRRTGVFHRYSDRDGLPSSNTVDSFAEDRAGNVWVGFWEGGLARYRDGRFTSWVDTNTTSWGGTIVYIDRSGRLWASSTSGLLRIDDPTADRPQPVASPLPLLDDPHATPLGEDDEGGFYFRFSQGVVRFDAAMRSVTRYTLAEGLAHLQRYVAFRDRDGAVWFGTSEGLSRLTPQPPRPAAPPPIAIGGVRIGGAAHPISDVGAFEVTGLRLPSDRRQLEIDFFAISFRVGDPIRFEYKLEGADTAWSRRTDQRTVNYAHLAPGSYRFLVRAVNGAGITSARPAAVAFTVLAPIWQRTWFLGLAGVLVAALVYGGVQYRMRRLLELERIRTRIATDLHDDIGASLSQIAILSEVVRRRAGSGETVITEPLAQIAATARELVDGMSDIVWAIDPHKDRVASLAKRMRRLGSDVLPGSDIGFDFQVSGEDDDRWVGADARRQVFLIFKEAINNIVRHAGATEVRVALGVENGTITLVVGDNGCGFDPAADSDGHGLRSLQDRARRLGGTLEIQSSVGHGTVVSMTCRAGGLPT